MTEHIGIVACSVVRRGQPCVIAPSKKSRLQRRGSWLYRNTAACNAKRFVLTDLGFHTATGWQGLR